MITFDDDDFDWTDTVDDFDDDKKMIVMENCMI